MTARSKMTDREKYNQARWRQGEPQREAERQKLLATGTPVKARITMALDCRMLEGPEVDVECGGVEPMVDEWEAGTRIPTPEQIVKLAELTQYPVEFFYEPADVEMGPAFMCGRGGCRVVTNESLEKDDQDARDRDAQRLFYDELMSDA